MQCLLSCLSEHKTVIYRDHLHLCQARLLLEAVEILRSRWKGRSFFLGRRDTTKNRYENPKTEYCDANPASPSWFIAALGLNQVTHQSLLKPRKELQNGHQMIHDAFAGHFGCLSLAFDA